MGLIQCRSCKKSILEEFAFCPHCGAPVKPPQKPPQKRRPKGAGTIIHLGGKRSAPYLVKLRGQFLGTFTAWEEANQFLVDYQSSHASHETINLTLGDIFDRYRSTQAYTDLSPLSRKNIDQAYAKIQHHAKTKMRDLTTSDYQEDINAASAAGCGHDGCAKVKTLVTALCRTAMKDNIIQSNYGELLELPKYVRTVQRRNFTEDEILTLFDHDSERDVQIVLTMIYSAVRIGELFGIRKENVFLDKRYMIGGEKTEAGTNRIIPIRDEIFPYIFKFMQEPGEFLISSPTGRQVNKNNWRSRNFYPLLDRLGFDYKDENGNNLLTPHRTRHTYISEAIAAKVRPEALRRIVGHASYKTSVEKYDDANISFLLTEAKKGL